MLTRAAIQPVELSWPDIVQVWRRGALLILLAGLLGATGFYALSYQMTPNYNAQAVLLLDRPDPGRLANPADAVQIDAVQRATLVRSQLEILRSDEIIRNVIRDLDLAHVPMFMPKTSLSGRIASGLARFAATLAPGLASPRTALPDDGSAESALVREYLQHLSVQQDTETYVLHVGFDATSPALAARILNAHVSAYLAWLQAQREEAVTSAANWLETAVANAHKRVVAAENAVELYRTEGELVDIDGRSSLDQGLTQMASDLAIAQTTLVRARARADQIRSLQRSGQIAGIVAMSGSTLLSGLQASTVEAAADVARLGGTLGARNPQYLAAKAHLAQLRAGMDGEINHLVQGEVSQANIAAVTAAQLKTALADSKHAELKSENSKSALNRLEAESEAESAVYLSLLTKLRSFDRAGELQKTEATPLSPALVSDVPTSPRRGLFLIFGFFLSAGAAAALAVWRAGKRGVVRHTADAALSSGIPQIGIMPELTVSRRLGGFDRTQMTYSFFRQELRSLCITLVRASGRPGRGLSVAVTSSLPGEGKSSFSAELALFAAENGMRTLLASTDPKPQAAQAKAARPKAGQPQAGALMSTEPVQPDRGLPLFRVQMMLNSSFSAHDEAASRIAGWQHDYDLIVVDTPPVSAIADSLILAPIVDATIVLARIDSTPRALLTAVVDQLEGAGGRIAGTVVTFVKLDRRHGVLPSDFSYYFGKSRDYHRHLASTQPLVNADTR